MTRTAPPGFTLIEMVVTIVILGIISAIAAFFMLKPVEGYFDTVRRTRLVETADFALRRIARDLATATPNSVRSTGGRDIIEMLQSRSGGRYCTALDCTDPLIGGTANSFRVLGPAIEVASGDSIVIGNLPGTACDAYASPSNNRRTISFTSSPVTTVAFSGTDFDTTCAEVTNRFQIVSGPVAFACDTATSTLWRYSGYTIQTSVPATVAALDALGGTKAALATSVACAGTSLDDSYKAEGLVELRIQVQSSNESVNLYRQVKVDNTP